MGQVYFGDDQKIYFACLISDQNDRKIIILENKHSGRSKIALTRDKGYFI